MISGVLHLSSKVTMGATKSGSIKRKFTSSSGDKMIVSTRKKQTPYDVYVVLKDGQICDWVGTVGDKETEFKFTRIRNNIKWKRIPKKLIEIDTSDDKRIDKTNENIFSIDPEGCLDIDDACHIKKNKDGYEIGIHIADVSYFIPFNSELDLKIRERSTSVYFPNETFHMIPEEISIKHCSLIKNKKKNAVTTIFQYYSDKNIIVCKGIFRSLIVNKYNYSYDEAQKMIDEKNKSDVHLLFQTIQKLYEDKLDAHTLIEKLMVMANCNAALELDKKYPDIGIFRTHQETIMKTIDDVNPDVMRKINIFNMEKAVYSVGNTNTEHYGLKQKYYTHFTSPIRRYADLMVHRLLLNDKLKINQEDIKKIINYANDVEKRTKKAQREAELLKIVYEIENYDITEGNVVRFHDNKADIWIPKYNIRTYSTIYSTKLGDIVDYIYDEKNNLLSVMVNNKEMFQLKLGQKIKIKLIPVIRESNFRNKLMVQLIEPNPCL